MKKNKEIIIIGAGPSGLSMAIFLSDLGYSPRIIDKKKNISKHSKALGVNPRTLELFKSNGVTAKFLSNGRKMHAVNLWKGNKHIYRNDFSKVNAEFPFMLMQAQKESEEILLDEVESRNIRVEYGSEFIDYRKSGSRYAVHIEGEEEHGKEYDFVVGADGGPSKVRDQIGAGFKGFKYEEEWELFDVELTMDVNPDEGHIRAFNDGGLIMMRIKDNVWRVAGNLKSILNYIPEKAEIGKVHWESTFKIHHKVAKNLSKENVVLIGDAAHLHSPVGARGMNLGIEDAHLASRLIHENRLDDYTKLRKPYIDKTVNRINNITMGMAGNSIFSRFLRSQIGNFRFLFPLVMPRVRNFVLGLD